MGPGEAENLPRHRGGRQPPRLHPDSVGVDEVPFSASAIDGRDLVLSGRGQGSMDDAAGPNREWAKIGGMVGGPAASRGPHVWSTGLGPG